MPPSPASATPVMALMRFYHLTRCVALLPTCLPASLSLFSLVVPRTHVMHVLNGARV